MVTVSSDWRKLWPALLCLTYPEQMCTMFGRYCGLPEIQSEFFISHMLMCTSLGWTGGRRQGWENGALCSSIGRPGRRICEWCFWLMAGAHLHLPCSQVFAILCWPLHAGTSIYIFLSLQVHVQMFLFDLLCRWLHTLAGNLNLALESSVCNWLHKFYLLFSVPRHEGYLFQALTVNREVFFLDRQPRSCLKFDIESDNFLWDIFLRGFANKVEFLHLGEALIWMFAFCRMSFPM